MKYAMTMLILVLFSPFIVVLGVMFAFGWTWQNSPYFVK